MLETMLPKRELTDALTHQSARSRDDRQQERLEFLGDAVIGLVIAEALMTEHPEWDEGRLSKRRSELVCAETLAAKARELDLHKHIVLGKGEERSGGRDKDRILAAAYEALAGAIYLKYGIDDVKEALLGSFYEEIGKKVWEPGDWKTKLQESTQRFGHTPEYRVVGQEGPAHAPTWKVEVLVNNQIYGVGSGTSKREAETQAAKDACMS